MLFFIWTKIDLAEEVIVPLSYVELFSGHQGQGVRQLLVGQLPASIGEVSFDIFLVFLI